MKTIKVKSSEITLYDDIYLYHNDEYVSINGEESDGSINLIPKDEWDLMMKDGLALINSTQKLINELKDKNDNTKYYM